MQLPLGPDPATKKLRAMHAALIAHIGRVIRPPDKRRDPVWTLVQGVIGARTKTQYSNVSTDKMLETYGSWEAVAKAPQAELRHILSTATFPELMAERLKACLQAIMAERGRVTLDHLHNLPAEHAMTWLEALPGVARKVSAGVMNASTFNRRALVIDTNHRRVVQRIGLVPAKADTLRAYNLLMPLLPEDWSPEDVDENHLLVKRVGQRWCRPSHMHCRQCPLNSMCKTARGQINRSG